MKLLLLTLNQQKVNKSGCHCLAKPRATPQSPESSSIQIVVHELWPIIIFSHAHVISVLRTTGKQSKQTSNRRCSQFSQHLKSPGPASPRPVTFPQFSHFQSSVLLPHFANSRLQQCQTATWISCLATFCGVGCTRCPYQPARNRPSRLAWPSGGCTLASCSGLSQ